MDASSKSLKANTGLHKARTLRANSIFSELQSTFVELVSVLAQRALPSRAGSGVSWEYRLFCGVLFCGLSGHPSLGGSQVSGGRGQSRLSELRARAIVLEERDLAITCKKRNCKKTNIECHIKKKPLYIEPESGSVFKATVMLNIEYKKNDLDQQ